MHVFVGRLIQIFYSVLDCVTVNRPPPPPFMRNALRNMQTSPLISTLQRSVRPVTYTIVSPGQGGVFTVASTSSIQQPLSVSSQTASSRLFGNKRAATSVTEVRPVPPSQANVALIPCLPTQSVVNPSKLFFFLNLLYFLCLSACLSCVVFQRHQRFM